MELPMTPETRVIAQYWQRLTPTNASYSLTTQMKPTETLIQGSKSNKHSPNKWSWDKQQPKGVLSWEDLCSRDNNVWSSIQEGWKSKQSLLLRGATCSELLWPTFGDGFAGILHSNKQDNCHFSCFRCSACSITGCWQNRTVAPLQFTLSKPKH